MIDRPHPDVLARTRWCLFRALSFPLPLRPLQPLLLCVMSRTRMTSAWPKRHHALIEAGRGRAELSLVARMKFDHSRHCFFCMVFLYVLFKRDSPTIQAVRHLWWCKAGPVSRPLPSSLSFHAQMYF